MAQRVTPAFVCVCVCVCLCERVTVRTGADGEDAERGLLQKLRVHAPTLSVAVKSRAGRFVHLHNQDACARGMCVRVC